MMVLKMQYDLQKQGGVNKNPLIYDIILLVNLCMGVDDVSYMS
jgi:hypothetical protein